MGTCFRAAMMGMNWRRRSCALSVDATQMQHASKLTNENNRDTQATMPRPIALTLGEPAGIGPDLAIAVWRRRGALGLPPFYVLGDPAYLARRSLLTGPPVELQTCEPAEAASIFSFALPVVDTGAAATARPGQPDGASAPAAIASIRLGVDHVLSGKAAAIVT